MMESKYICAFCAQINEITIDPSEGFKQSLEEECEFCDHVNFLEIYIEPDSFEVEIESRTEE